MPVPNGYDCGDCDKWDDINGCLEAKRNIYGCHVWHQLDYGMEEEMVD